MEKTIDIKVYGTKVTQEKARRALTEAGELTPEQIEEKVASTFKGRVVESEIDETDPIQIADALDSMRRLWGCETLKALIDRTNKHLCDKHRAAFHRGSGSGQVTKAQILEWASTATPEAFNAYQEAIKAGDTERANQIVRGEAQ